MRGDRIVDERNREGGFIPWLRILVPSKDNKSKQNWILVKKTQISVKKKIKGRRIFSWAQ